MVVVLPVVCLPLICLPRPLVKAHPCSSASLRIFLNSLLLVSIMSIYPKGLARLQESSIGRHIRSFFGSDFLEFVSFDVAVNMQPNRRKYLHPYKYLGIEGFHIV